MRMRRLPVTAAVGLLLISAACADSPTLSDTPTQRQMIAPGAPGYDELQGCVTDPNGVCPIGGIVVNPGAPPPDCNVWYSPSCGECMTGGVIAGPDGISSVCLGGGGTDPAPGGGGDPYAPGGGGGGGTPPPPPCPDDSCEAPEPSPDPCVTGDAKLDDPDVYDRFSSLWAGSNYDPGIPQEQRREKAAWLVQDALGYRLVEIVNAYFYPCSVDIRETPPAGAVGLVHTHPWRVGEVVTTCASGAVLYTGTPSEDDQATLRRFGFSTGYILDASGIGRFSGSGGEAAQREHRCGY